MPNEPVQLLLNAGVLRSPRELSTPVNNGTDFFAGNDQGFAAHRDALVAATKAIRRALQTSTVAGGVGYVKVIMQRDAIAKSHRPQKALFRGRWTPQVGTDGLGEPIFAVTPESLDKVLEALESAETTVTDRVHRETGVVSANPSRKRCEASAYRRDQPMDRGRPARLQRGGGIRLAEAPRDGQHLHRAVLSRRGGGRRP